MSKPNYLLHGAISLCLSVWLLLGLGTLNQILHRFLALDSGEVQTLHAVVAAGTSYDSDGMALDQEITTTNQVWLPAISTQPSVTPIKGQVHFYHGDHLGSASLITNSQGEVVERISYYPYGLERTRQQSQPTDSPVAYRFTGQEWDQEITLYDYGARFYDPVVARFISADPLFTAQPNRDLANPQSQNLYAYTLNNPLRYIDPSGLERTDFLIANSPETGGKIYVVDPIEITVDPNYTEPTWLSYAWSEMGTHEAVDLPRINEYFESTNRGGKNTATEPWCSAFANWVMEQAAIESGNTSYDGTKKSNAISWLKWGKAVDRPSLGSIGVIEKKGGKGHVGFVIGRDEKKPGNLLLLGGNQDNQVSIRSIPEKNFSSFRVPENYDVPQSDYELPTGTAQDMMNDR